MFYRKLAPGSSGIVLIQFQIALDLIRLWLRRIGARQVSDLPEGQLGIHGL